MSNKTTAFFRPGQDFTALCSNDVQARRLAYFTAPAEGSDHLAHVSNARGAAGDVPAGVVGFSQAEGATTHIGTSGIVPVLSATAAAAGNPAYDNGDGQVTAEAGGGDEGGGNALVGVYVRPVSEGAEAVVKLHLS